MYNDLKLVIVGGLGTGKTALMEKFVYGTFDSEHRTTIGAVYVTKSIQTRGKKIVIGIWDTAGQERFRTLMRMFYKDAKVAIVCHDVTNKNTWTEMKSWLTEVQQYCEKDCLIYICGTKKDICDQDISLRQTSYEFALSYAQGICSKYFEVSNKTGEYVEELFQVAVDDYVDLIWPKEIKKSDTLVLTPMKKKQKSWFSCLI